MDRNVTVRFYEITNGAGGRPNLEAALRSMNDRAKRDREEEIEEGVILRLEHLTEIDDLMIGDITRVQSRNLPGHVVDDDVDRLPVDQIGHSTAFLYDPATNCLAFQFDMQTGIGRLCRYLRTVADGDAFAYMPYLRGDTLNRFRTQSPTKLTLRVSRIRNFRGLAATTDFEDQIGQMAQMFDAPSMEVTCSTRGQDNSLDAAQVWNTVRRWVGFSESIEGIKKIEAKTLEADEAFNFIKDLLYEKRLLDLPDNDPIASRAVRQDYVRECYDQHRQYIRRVSGVV